MKTECSPVDAIANPRVSALAPCEPELLILHGALDIEQFWEAVIIALRSALMFHHSSMALLPAERFPGTLRVSNPVAHLKLYAAKIEAMAPVYAILARNPNACVLRLSDEVSIESLTGTPFYKNFMKPEGWWYSASMIFREGRRMLGRLCLSRRADQGDFTDEEMTLLNALYVHFNVAAQRVCRFEKERKADTVHAQSGTECPGTLLLDERCVAVFHNRAAVSICLLWRLGPVQARVVKPEFCLPEEIRSACEDLCAEWQKRPRKGRLAQTQAMRTVAHAGGLTANVQLLRMGRSYTAKTHFLVHLSQIATRGPDVSVLALMYRLTATEQAVAKLVAWGLDNQQVATELRISVNTVRSHLHNIFHKLGVNCRGKLAVLLRVAVF
jgi:DNA-binding CsgD family transcriptional regulator